MGNELAGHDQLVDAVAGILLVGNVVGDMRTAGYLKSSTQRKTLAVRSTRQRNRASPPSPHLSP